jgi:succinate-semialdehyde dehydrogenase/glutarate-semialdehyde dehydrogenase
LAINGSNTQVGPLSSEEALIDILDQVERFEKQVPNLVGGKRAFDTGACNLLTNLKRGVPTLRKNYLAQ